MGSGDDSAPKHTCVGAARPKMTPWLMLTDRRASAVIPLLRNGPTLAAKGPKELKISQAGCGGGGGEGGLSPTPRRRRKQLLVQQEAKPRELHLQRR